MRLGVIVLGLFLIAPTALAVVDTRTVHNAFFNALNPAPFDVNASPLTLAQACSDFDQLPASKCSQNQGAVGFTYVPGFYECGVPDSQLRVRFQNPSVLQPLASSGNAPDATKSPVVATSSFYVIPEVSGTLASSVTAIWFAFLETLPTGPVEPDTICADANPTAQAGISASGTYYEFYRGDTDPSDGWIIPINTLQVPDNIYGAVLRAWGAPTTPALGGSVPLKTFVTYAIVDNYAADETYRPSTPTNCQDLGNCLYRDHVPPWPSIVPGDRAMTAGETSFKIEWGETVIATSVSVSYGGVVFSGQTVGPSTPRDVDSAAIVTVTTDTWGSQVIFTPGGTIDCSKELKVTAQDLRGNMATKTVAGGSYC